MLRFHVRLPSFYGRRLVVGGWVGKAYKLLLFAPPAYSIVLLNGLPEELCNYFALYIYTN
jgi:hypothetical protein